MFTRDDWDGHWIASDDEDLTTIVWDGVTPVVSVLEVAVAGRYNHRNDEFLTVINPNDFRFGARDGRGNEGELRHKHEWARDDEGDRSMTAYLQFTDLNLVSAFATTTNYTAWLMEMPQFFPKGFEENPYLTAEKIEPEYVEKTWGNGNTYEETQNVGYPYTPPKIIGGKQKIALPLRIELTFRINTPGNGYNDLTEYYGKKWEEYIK